MVLLLTVLLLRLTSPLQEEALTNGNLMVPSSVQAQVY